MPTETITLAIKSPAAPLSGLDAFIARLERADELIDRLARPKPIKVEFAIHGLEKIEIAGANIDGLAASLRALGETKIADQLTAGLISPGEAAKFSAAEVEKLKLKVHELNETEVAARAKFGSSKIYNREDYDNLQAQKKALSELTKERGLAEQRLAGFARVSGLAEGAIGAEKIEQTAAAERKLAPAAEASADALAHQHAVVAAKIKTMDRLTASVMRATEAEAEQAAAAAVSQRANTSAAAAQGLLSEKIRTTAEGEETRIRKFRAGPGQTRTEESGGGTVAERNLVESFKRQFEELDVEFARRRAAVAGAAAPLSTQVQLLDLEARARGDVVQAMHAQGLGAESLADRQKVLIQQSELQQRQLTGRIAAPLDEQIRRQRELNEETARNLDLSRRMQAEFTAFGGKQKRTFEQMDAGGRTVKTKAIQEDPTGLREQIELVRRFDAAGRELEPTLTRTSNALERTGRGVTSVGAGFVRNLASVTAWGAAVSTLYGTLQVLEFGFGSAVKFNRQFATLQTVFRGTRDEARELGQQVLELAASNGRSGDEAVDAAVRWSRLGLTQRETAEAVAVSLQAANVAEITAAESAEALASIFASYRLEVGDLRTVLNELNTVSNTLNVTNKDLLGGIARTGSIAKQAGIPIAELIGLIGAGVSRTGRSGAEIGNAIKSVIVAISNPELQKTLRDSFKFDVKTPIGDLKDMSEVISELYVKIQSLDSASRAEILQKIGGKQQASRLNAILDGYVTSQVKAIQAQRDLSSADRESALIRGTLISQVTTLTTEFQRLFSATLEFGGENSLLSFLSKASAGVGGLIKLFADHPQLGRILAGPLTQIADVAAAVPSRGGAREQFGSAALAKARADADAMERAARLARVLGQGIGPLAGRDRTAAGRALREFSSISGGEDLSKLLQANKIEEVRTRLQRTSQTMAERAHALREDETRLSGVQLSKLEATLATQQALVEERMKAGKNTDVERKAVEQTEAAIDRMKSGKTEGLFKDFSEFEGFDPLDAIKKQFSDRSKVRIDALRDFFEKQPGPDTALSKVNLSDQANRAEAEYLRGLERSRTEGDATTAQEQMNRSIIEEVTTRREALQIEMDKVSVLRQSAILQDALMRGAREARAAALAFQIGTSDTAQLLSEASGVRGLSGGLSTRGPATILGAKGPAALAEEAAQRQGQLIGYANRLLEIQVSLGERRYSVERDIANERERANREASKALQLASREDQLRAALLTKFTQGRAFTPESFQFLDKETREAAEKFVPSALPSSFDNKGRELEKERGLLKDVEQVMDVLKAEADFIRSKATGGGPDFTGAAPQISAPISMQFSEQFSEITRTLASAVDAKLQVQIDQIRTDVNGFIAGLNYAGAQSVGASTLAS